MTLQIASSSSLSEPVESDGSASRDGLADVYALCDPAFAQDWLARSGLDEIAVARKTCLSVAQVRQLLQGSDASFYSAAIKRRAYQRVLALLGAPQPEAVVSAMSTSSLQHIADEMPAVSLPELTVHQSPQPEQAVSMTVDKKRPGSLTYTAWAWLGLGLLVAAVTAQMWHGWLSAQVQRWRPIQEVQAPEPPQPPVTQATVTEPEVIAAPTPGAAPPAPCAVGAQPPVTVMPAVAQKPGNYVYVQAHADMSLCVVDGEHRVTELQLKEGEARSVYGAPPWQISGADLTRLHIYFQGWRVMLPEMATQQVSLVERSR